MGNTPVKVDPKGNYIASSLSLNTEEMKNNKRMMDRASRKIDRERTKVENQEKLHMKEI